ncbi:MAG: nuclear transport factor 2 family protein [Patescibacteria group bacterium]|nr:nuclear transport factor 2 family protein [Patescibacteria group bacterium]
MELNKLKSIMKKYGEAWEKQDPDLLLKIFDKDGTYQVTPFEKPIEGHSAIKKYWIKNPQKDQKNIKFKLGRCAVYNGSGYAEWISKFDQISSSKSIELRGIIIITLKNNKIISLREYWHATK